MRIALTGATGLIGSHVPTELQAPGHEVIALVRDEAHADLIRLAVPPPSWWIYSTAGRGEPAAQRGRGPSAAPAPGDATSADLDSAVVDALEAYGGTGRPYPTSAGCGSRRQLVSGGTSCGVDDHEDRATGDGLAGSATDPSRGEGGPSSGACRDARGRSPARPPRAGRQSLLDLLAGRMTPSWSLRSPARAAGAGHGSVDAEFDSLIGVAPVEVIDQGHGRALRHTGASDHSRGGVPRWRVERGERSRRSPGLHSALVPVRAPAQRRSLDGHEDSDAAGSALDVARPRSTIRCALLVPSPSTTNPMSRNWKPAPSRRFRPEPASSSTASISAAGPGSGSPRPARRVGHELPLESRCRGRRTEPFVAAPLRFWLAGTHMPPWWGPAAGVSPREGQHNPARRRFARGR